MDIGKGWIKLRRNMNTPRATGPTEDRSDDDNPEQDRHRDGDLGWQQQKCLPADHRLPIERKAEA